MPLKILLSFSLFLLANICIASESLSIKLDKLVQEYVDVNEFSGTVLVAKDGKTLFEKGYGFANVEWQIPNAVDTKFRIASTTKPFTAMLILQLVDEGKLKLNNTVSDILPNYRKDTGSKVTIHQLLNHTSGIPDIFRQPDYKKIKTNNTYSVDEFITHLCSGDLAFEPGTKFSYSNAGYVILGKIVEHLTNKTFEQALTERILKPLNMMNTGFDSPKKIILKRASGYEKTLDGLVGSSYVDISVPYSSGSMYSTAPDLLKWSQAIHNKRLINKSLYQQLFQPSKQQNYGYGWLIEKLDATIYGNELTQIHHPGMIKGFNSNIVQIRESNIFIALLNNTGGASLRALTSGILDVLHGKSHLPAKPRIFSILFKTIKNNGLEKGVKQYRELEKNGKGLSERSLNYFGYELLKVNHVKAAIEFLKMNTENHPESANVFDSLGEAYLADNKLSLALKSYEKAFALNNNSDNAKNKIEKIRKLLN